MKLNAHGPGTGLALILLTITQIPIAIKTTAEIYCMEKVGQMMNSGVTAISYCNGGKP